MNVSQVPGLGYLEMQGVWHSDSSDSSLRPTVMVLANSDGSGEEASDPRIVRILTIVV